MSDSNDQSDRNRRRKRRNVRPRELNPIAPGKALVILSKPQSERQNDSKESTSLLNSQQGNFPELSKAIEIKNTKPNQTFKLKSRDRDSSVSSAVTSGSPPLTHHAQSTDDIQSSSPTTPSAFPSSPTPSYQIAQSKYTSSSNTHEEELENKLAPYHSMKSCVKLVDENMKWSESCLEYLQDQTDFYVIGVIGLQGVGKSTVMSIIGSGGQMDADESNYVFPPESLQTRLISDHGTEGIDIFVTRDRIILLDVQPLLSASVIERLIEAEKKYSPDYNSIIQASEIQSLQIASFLYTVCHTVLVVQDWFTDPNLLRFLQTAEMLKPSTPSQQSSVDTVTEDSDEDYYPHIVFIQNKCKSSDFTTEKMKEMQDILSLLFYKSQLKYKGSVGMHHDNLVPCLTPVAQSGDMNLFLIPEKHSNDDNAEKTTWDYNGYPRMCRLLESLHHQILSMPRSMLTRVAITEKNWFHYAARTWESIKKSNLMSEYGRLLS